MKNHGSIAEMFDKQGEIKYNFNSQSDRLLDTWLVASGYQGGILTR